MTNQCSNRILISGRYFSEDDLVDVKEIIRMFPNLSRTELANTICENLGWVTAIWPARRFRCWPNVSGLTGISATATARFCWKPSSTLNNTGALATRRQTGFIWAEPRAVDGWTATTKDLLAAKISMFTP